MFSGGSLAEGWACNVCDLMEEIGFLSPLESVMKLAGNPSLESMCKNEAAMWDSARLPEASAATSFFLAHDSAQVLCA